MKAAVENVLKHFCMLSKMLITLLVLTHRPPKLLLFPLYRMENEGTASS